MSEQTVKVPAVKFQILGGEIPDYYVKDYDSWAALGKATHSILWDHDRRYPNRDGGYDKTDVLITWADGYTWKMRMDIGENSRDRDACPYQHIRDYLRFMTVRPAHIPQAAYDEFWSEPLEVRQEQMRYFLATYELPG